MTGQPTTVIYLADPAIRAEQLEAIRNRLPAGWTLADAPAGAAAILTENMAVTPEMAAAAGPSLRLIARLQTGSAAIAETTVPVVELPNTALTGVAELTVLLILALSRHLVMVSRQTLAQAWLPDRSEPILTDQRRYTYNWIGLQDFGTLYGKSVGLVGLGLIGRATAERLAGFGVRLLYTQRHRLDAATEARYGVQWRSLDELLAESDFVSLHHRFQEGPEGNDNHIGARELALMKPTAYLINTARGRLVDEDALVAALQEGRIAGAGLDVFRYEPLPPDHPLFALAGDNVILTPHVAGAPIVEAWQTTARELIEHVQHAIAQDASQPV
jgi:phosphoglycerate dehydrogenase-like enzyme